MFNYWLAILIGGAMAFTTSVSAHAAQTLKLQQRADELREEGKSLDAIDCYNQAIVRYQGEQDYAGMMEALTGRLLSWKHLFYKTNDKIYAIFVKKETEAMLEIAEEHGLLDKLHLIHFLNGTAATLLQNYPRAEEEFKKAVALHPFNDAGKGDWIAHLGEAVYKNGKKEEGKKIILQGVEIIQEKSSQIDSFLFNVWVSGAYLRLAKLLQTDRAEESQYFLNQAKKIIDSDTRLVIRKQQLEMYLSSLG